MDYIDKLIQKEEETISKLSDDEKKKLKTSIETVVPKENYTVQLENLDSNAAPFIITQPEFMQNERNE